MLLYKEASIVEDLTYTFLRTVITNYRLLEEIISDRDKLFISKFQTLIAKLGTRQKISTIFYPQMDGQTERLNQTMEVYLRYYVNYQQNDQVDILLIVQFVYNSIVTETTKISLFYANYRYEPEVYRTEIPGIVFADTAILEVS